VVMACMPSKTNRVIVHYSLRMQDRIPSSQVESRLLVCCKVVAADEIILINLGKRK
jgi:hypothetical protein